MAGEGGEPVHALQWAIVALRASSAVQAVVAGRVYRFGEVDTSVLENVLYPYITVQVVTTSPDLDDISGVISHVEVVLQITIYGDDDVPILTLVDGMKAVHSALHLKGGDVSGATIAQCLRQRALVLPPEFERQRTYTPLGAEYRLWVQAA